MEEKCSTFQMSRWKNNQQHQVSIKLINIGMLKLQQWSGHCMVQLLWPKRNKIFLHTWMVTYALSWLWFDSWFFVLVDLIPSFFKLKPECLSWLNIIYIASLSVMKLMTWTAIHTKGKSGQFLLGCCMIKQISLLNKTIKN